MTKNAIITDPKSWSEAIQIRRSRRKYLSKPIGTDVMKELEDTYAVYNREMQGVRIVVVQDNPDAAFKGMIGSYGKVKGAPAYAAFIGDMDDPNVQEKLGYIGECAILEATAKGLGTCWVAGFFRPEVVAKQIEIAANEKVLSITPIGYSEEDKSKEEQLMSDLAGSHKRKPLEELCTGLPKDQWASWMEKALEAARLAPSAVNRQPWRFIIEEKAIIVSVDSTFNLYRISKRLDCGIAMLHIEVEALEQGIQGTWTYLEGEQVAKFEVGE